MTAIVVNTETIVTMPPLGESVEEGTVSRWLIDVGDRVEVDEPLLEVATDKVDTEIPAPCAGVLTRIVADVDAVVAIGEALAVITAEISAMPPVPLSQVAEPRSSDPAELHPVASLAPAPEPRQPENVAAVNGSTEKLPAIRRTIARRMMESLQTSAQLTTVVEVDVTRIAALRTAHKSDFRHRTGRSLSFFPFFARAAVAALADHRVLHASVNSEFTEITYFGSCHLAIAVDGPRGLLVPVIRNADKLSVGQLAAAIAELADKVRTERITPDELAGGTFTLTNTGSRGALFDTPIINQPQAAILGAGAVVERIVPTRDDAGALRIEARSMAYLSLSYDHRVVDGADAARYLSAVRSRLEAAWDPDELQS
ncbi:MAG: 2-oxo acid dehydrogenase subunit E2 [Mycobacterium sp.]